MLYPSIDHLVNCVDSKYTLVVVAAKRARQLQDHMLNNPNSSTTKNVSRGLWEIADGTIHYERIKEAVK